MPRLRILLIFAVFCAAVASSSQAAIIVTVSDATVTPGGTAFVDVFIRSSSTDPLQSFGFEHRITTGGATRLEFVDPQPDPQLTNPDYVFLGDSFDQINVFPVGAVSTSSVPNDTFVGGDLTDSFADVTLTTTSLLLASLQVTTNTLLPPVLGDTFSVTFDDTSFNTFFVDSGFSFLTIDTINSDFTGTVTVVPEPSSLLLALLGLFGGIAWVGRRRRRAKRSPQPPGIA